ncbi:hypothetical protein [Micromonospora sp. NPDC092111]|uniref:hypothetical protein n=1 Tax=Micromonospora sp. NPDC092111 TaxID=3364289 RepID=UPI0038247134
MSATTRSVIARVADDRLSTGGGRVPEVVLAEPAGPELARLPLPRELAERTVTVAPN